MRILLLILLLNARPTYSGEVSPMVVDLLQDYGVYNEQCRGGPGNDANTWKACGARDYIGYLLGRLGWCFGKQGQPDHMRSWFFCEDGSSLHMKP